MSDRTKESSSQNRCVEETLPFRAIAQRLKKPAKSKIYGIVKSRRRTRGTLMSDRTKESASQYKCDEAILPFRAIAQRLKIGGK